MEKTAKVGRPKKSGRPKRRGECVRFTLYISKTARKHLYKNALYANSLSQYVENLILSESERINAEKASGLQIS
jgi:hypothetical protein